MATYIGSTAISNAYIGIPNPESITLDKSSITLTTIGQTEQLTATLSPTPCDQSITWSTSDSTIATVSTSGLVTCVTPGTCTITATTSNGLTATCGVIQSRLPSGYQEVEWIEPSSQGPAIGTGLSASSTLSIEMVITPNTSYVSENAILGNYWSASALFFMFYQGKYRLHNGGTVTDGPTATSSLTTITIDSSEYTINGTPYACSTGGYYGGGADIWIWDVASGSSGTRGVYKLHSMQIKDSGTLVRDFVPCYRIADSVIGMYDLVNNVFYTNDGTGTFTKGNDV